MNTILPPFNKSPLVRPRSSQTSAAEKDALRSLKFDPEAGEAETLAKELVSAGLITPEAAQGACRIVAEHGDTVGARALAIVALRSRAARGISDKCLDMVERLHGLDGHVELTAINAHGGGRVSVSGTLRKDHETFRKFLVDQTLRGWNLYIVRDPVRSSLPFGAQASSDDIAESRFSVQDFDDVSGSAADDIVSKVRAAGAVEVLHTGGGIQAWWRLKPAADPGEQNRRAALSKKLAVAIGADGAACNRHQPVRLAPSINNPNPSKRKRGRRLGVARTLMTTGNRTEHDD